MSVRIAPVLCLWASACVAEGPLEVADAAAWYRDPELLGGPDYAGCTGVRGGAAGWANVAFDEGGHPTALTEGSDGARQITRWSWAGDAWLGELVEWVADGEPELVAATAWQWEDGFPAGESRWPGRWARFTYDDDGHRLEEEWAGDSRGDELVTWTWLAHGDGTTATAQGGSGAPRSFAWDAERRLVARSVRSTVVRYGWRGDALESIEVDGGPTTTRWLVDGRVAYEWVDGAETTWSWTCR